jgi:hypothetical protein
MFETSFFRNIDRPERFQIHDTTFMWTNPYNFQEFPKYSLFECCHYCGHGIYATYAKHLQDVCKYFI